jgi:hypothetical protein
VLLVRKVDKDLLELLALKVQPDLLVAVHKALRALRVLQDQRVRRVNKDHPDLQDLLDQQAA